MPLRLTASVFAMSLAAILAAGCRSASSAGATASAPATPAAPADAAPTARAAAGRVFFVQPATGATVKSPVHFEFGSEMFTIAAVPERVVAPRATTGHFHLGLDTDCLPAGTIIPRGTPAWLHFGTGANTSDQQLPPGSHKVSVQAGDDEHRAVAGMCQTITITVAP